MTIRGSRGSRVEVLESDVAREGLLPETQAAPAPWDRSPHLRGGGANSRWSATDAERNDLKLRRRAELAERPLGSIIIPARNEATVVTRALADVFNGVDPDAFEVVVACNGCTDTTVQAASEAGVPVTVLDLPAVGKAGAIRAAELTVHSMPRLYLDADVRLDGRSAAAVLTALQEGAIAARPPLAYDTTGASWLVRRYYRQRLRLPSIHTDLCGAGVYGLSAAARDRFGAFPDVVADDLFAARIVEPSEVTIVPCAPVEISVPRNARSLIRTLARAHSGNRELFEKMPALARPTTGSIVSELRNSMRVRSQFVDAVVYASIVTIGRLHAMRRARAWARDDSSRPATE